MRELPDGTYREATLTVADEQTFYRMHWAIEQQLILDDNGEPWDEAYMRGFIVDKEDRGWEVVDGQSYLEGCVQVADEWLVSVWPEEEGTAVGGNTHPVGGREGGNTIFKAATEPEALSKGIAIAEDKLGVPRGTLQPVTSEERRKREEQKASSAPSAPAP